MMLLPFVADRSWQPLSEPICAQLADALGGKDARWRHPSGNADVYGLEASEGDVAIYMHGVVGNSGEWVGVAVRTRSGVGSNTRPAWRRNCLCLCLLTGGPTSSVLP